MENRIQTLWFNSKDLFLPLENATWTEVFARNKNNFILSTVWWRCVIFHWRFQMGSSHKLFDWEKVALLRGQQRDVSTESVLQPPLGAAGVWSRGNKRWISLVKLNSEVWYQINSYCLHRNCLACNGKQLLSTKHWNCHSKTVTSCTVLHRLPGWL